MPGRHCERALQHIARQWHGASHDPSWELSAAFDHRRLQRTSSVHYCKLYVHSVVIMCVCVFVSPTGMMIHRHQVYRLYSIYTELHIQYNLQLICICLQINSDCFSILHSKFLHGPIWDILSSTIDTKSMWFVAGGFNKNSLVNHPIGRTNLPKAQTHQLPPNKQTPLVSEKTPVRLPGTQPVPNLSFRLAFPLRLTKDLWQVAPQNTAYDGFISRFKPPEQVTCDIIWYNVVVVILIFAWRSAKSWAVTACFPESAFGS